MTRMRPVDPFGRSGSLQTPTLDSETAHGIAGGLPLFPAIDMDQTSSEPLVWSRSEEAKAVDQIASALAQQREYQAQHAWVTCGSSTLPSPKPETANNFANSQNARIESLFGWLMNEDSDQIVFTGADPVLFELTE